METIKIAVNVLVIKQSKVLLGKRLNVTGNGTYGVPGGHLEFGEDLKAAAARELKEETGLVAEELEFLQVVNNPRKETHYLHVNFLATKWQGNVENKEPHKCEGWEWFDLNNLPKNIFLPHASFVPAYLEQVNYVERRLNDLVV